MKIFVVTADVELTQKPAWLDDFRARFDKPYDYHVTLKQPCVMEDGQVDEIKSRLADLLPQSTSTPNPIHIQFDQLFPDRETNGTFTIMIDAKNATAMETLQKKCHSSS